ncbi:MAG TPA: thioredoxin-dependent thiol peroxidase [Oligoflexia bacterium]|nr:thioredoxin-dependent thiol peroxidase [Oligoflexia bacterium]HMR25020.1 thioredoxin-dependent thiol peroxidase [Oligoflexia bacterium]
MIEVGKKAPNFKLPNEKGEMVSLSQFKGKKLLLYFYPKDSTPGCTKEAQGFTQLYKDYKKLGYTILGVSKDSQASHQKFIDKYDLGFHLLVDQDNELAKAFGAFGEKNMYGKKVMGVIRSTFLIDEKGKIEKAIKVSKAAEHPQKLLEEIG